MVMTRSTLCDGTLGVKLPNAPLGTDVLSDEDLGLTIHNDEDRLQWSINFYENLHMDLCEENRAHLRNSIER